MQSRCFEGGRAVAAELVGQVVIKGEGNMNRNQGGEQERLEAP